MRSITVRRDDFVAAVKRNRDSHKAAFDQALSGYRARWIEELERRLSDVRHGRAIDQGFRFPEPEDHTKDYNRVLTMARMSVDDELELSEHEFGMYVMDQWDWKDAFVQTTSLYGRVQ